MRSACALTGAGLLALTLLAPGAQGGPADMPRDERGLISLNSRVIDPRQPAEVPEHLRAEPADDEYLLVKFPGPVSAAQLAALRRATSRVYTYLPHDTFLVRRLRSDDRRRALDLAAVGVVYVEPFHPAYKLSRFVEAVQAGEDPASDEARDRIVMVQVYPDADLASVREKLEGLGAKVVGARRNAFFSRLRLLLPPAEIVRLRDSLARLPEVFWVDLESRRVLLNDTTVWVGQSGLSGGQATPVFAHGIYGEGQVVAVLDTGIDPDMCYFRDPARGLPPTNACNGGTAVDTTQRKVIGVDFLWSSECSGGLSSSEWDTQGHGTHVAGTVAGDNFANLLVHDAGDGMAPGAKLVVQDCGYQVNNCADCPGIGCPVVDLNPIFQQTYDQGARLHTNSWGDQENASPQNDYTTGSQDADEFMWNHKDFLIFFAAGNSGPGTASVGSPSTAKSVVSVGATQRATSANSMASFSSCGPTDDNRIKPEITVPGSNIVSARNDTNTGSNNCSTTALSGTSMATPGAAGLTALIRQYYTDGWYPSGSAVGADGFTPSAALLRATLVNSGESMTGAGAVPDNCQGWGRVLLENALYFSGQTRRLWALDDAPAFPSGSSNETRSYTFDVQAGTPLKVTLAWTDYPSTPAANPHLNNDLDLAVSGPGGATWLGNVFAGGQSGTGGAADRRNTLEQVFLASPGTGTYTVTVRSFNVPNGPQPFALVVTGAATTGGGSDTTPPVTSITAPAAGSTVSGTVSVTASASDNVGVTNVQFYVDGALAGSDATSPYAYSWNTASVSNGSHTLQSRAYDAAGNVGNSTTISVTVNNTTGPPDLTASFDATLQAPKCTALGRSCDTGAALVLGRANLGPEPNQPNTIADSCADGTSGTFHSDESNDRLKVSTTDGSAFAPGKTVRIDATVWAYSSYTTDKLDLYYAANASSPSWTFITTLTPTAAGAQTLSATYTLPSGSSLQAVRAVFRYQGSAGACVSGSYNDRDDLVFAVDAPPPTPDFSVACSPASLSAIQGGSAASTCTVTSTGGFASAVSLACAGLPSGATCSFSPASVTPPANGTVNSSLTVSVASSTTIGAYNFTANGTSGSTTRSANLSLNVTSPVGDVLAAFDTTLQAPKCTAVGRSCDTGAALVLGRSTKGPEPNYPNTINDSCADGTSGTYHVDESNDRLKVSTTDGSALAPGKTVRIDATVWAYSSYTSDKLDLYYAANAASPTWTFIGTLTPTAAGAQTLSATYTLPAGTLQAVRAQFRYTGSAGTCTSGGYNDRDDLVFAVNP